MASHACLGGYKRLMPWCAVPLLLLLVVVVSAQTVIYVAVGGALTGGACSGATNPAGPYCADLRSAVGLNLADLTINVLAGTFSQGSNGNNFGVRRQRTT